MKNKIMQIRMSEEDIVKLDKLTQSSKSSRSATIRELIDKATYTKPKVLQGLSGGTVITCPRCSAFLDDDYPEWLKHTYCPICGQHISIKE